MEQHWLGRMASVRSFGSLALTWHRGGLWRICNPSRHQHPEQHVFLQGGTVTGLPRVVRDAGKIADEVITHLVGLVGSSVRVTLEIEAEIPGGAPENVVRTVTENSRTLKFESNSGFETE